MAVAEIVAIAAPNAATGTAAGEENAISRISGANTTATTMRTTSILARITRDGTSGAVAIRSGASSPEIESQAIPPASWPAAITITGTNSAAAFAPVPKLRHIITAG